jgi:PAS domain-containing protein
MTTFYLDMDGVVADWDTAAEQFLGVPFRSKPRYGEYRVTSQEWDRLRAQHRFYRDLPLMAQCEQLVNLARNYRDQLGWQLLFLTAVPHNNDQPWAFSDKVLWAQERFPDIAVHFGPHSTDKWRHCEPGDILVDDRGDNCAAWRAAGGTAFKVDDRDLLLTIEAVTADLASRINDPTRQLALDIY